MTKKYRLTRRGEEVILALEAIGGALLVVMIYVELWLIFS